MPISDFTEDEIRDICSQCHSLSAMARALNYASRGAILYTIRDYLEKHNIDYSHFTGKAEGLVKRTEENIFILNSTASQHTLRCHYLAGGYTPYKCAICGQEPFWNGKPMTLILDHINGCNHDDRLENLRWVCGNCDRQLSTTTGCNKNHGIRVEKYTSCIDCGKQISRHNQRCKTCHAKYLAKHATKHYKVNKEVHRDELKALIRTLPMTKVANEYGVTDNAIRRWCRKFSLPSSSKEILLINDKDWAKI